MNDDKTTSVVLRVRGLCFAHPPRALFNNLSVDIPSGVSLIRGEDSCGKTSLLRLFAGQLAADSGQLQIRDSEVGQHAEAYCRQVFWIDPRSDKVDQLSPHAYFETVRQQYPEFDDAVLAEVVSGLALMPHLDKALYMLSTGSKRKVWLAAAFASGAALTLLDEPFAALDHTSIQFVMHLLAQAAHHPSRAWVISHYDSLGEITLGALINLPSSQ